MQLHLPARLRRGVVVLWLRGGELGGADAKGSRGSLRMRLRGIKL